MHHGVPGGGSPPNRDCSPGLPPARARLAPPPRATGLGVSANQGAARARPRRAVKPGVTCRRAHRQAEVFIRPEKEHRAPSAGVRARQPPAGGSPSWWRRRAAGLRGPRSARSLGWAPGREVPARRDPACGDGWRGSVGGGEARGWGSRGRGSRAPYGVSAFLYLQPLGLVRPGIAATMTQGLEGASPVGKGQAQGRGVRGGGGRISGHCWGLEAACKVRGVFLDAAPVREGSVWVRGHFWTLPGFGGPYLSQGAFLGTSGIREGHSWTLPGSGGPIWVRGHSWALPRSGKGDLGRYLGWGAPSGLGDIPRHCLGRRVFLNIAWVGGGHFLGREAFLDTPGLRGHCPCREGIPRYCPG